MNLPLKDVYTANSLRLCKSQAIEMLFSYGGVVKLFLPILPTSKEK